MPADARLQARPAPVSTNAPEGFHVLDLGWARDSLLHVFLVARSDAELHGEHVIPPQVARAAPDWLQA